MTQVLTSLTMKQLFRTQTQNLTKANIEQRRKDNPEEAREIDEEAEIQKKLLIAREKMKNSSDKPVQNLFSRKRTSSIAISAEKPKTKNFIHDETTLQETPDSPPQSRNKKQKTAIESITTISHLDESTTMTTPPRLVLTSSSSQQNDVIAPHLNSSTRAQPPNIKEMKKNNRKPGGQLQDPGVWFYATYENSAALARAFKTFATFCSETFMIVFNSKAMRIFTRDDAGILLMHMEVPRTSFLCYENLCDSKIAFVIASKKMKRFADACTSEQTITFCRNQNGNKGEPMELLLCPLDGSFESGIVTRATFKSNDEQPSELMPVSPHQYQITMKSSLFAAKVKQLVAESSDICLEFSSTTFKMSAIDDEGGGDMYLGVPVKRSVREALDTDCCFIERLPDADPRVTLGDIPHSQFNAAYLETMTHFGRHINFPDRMRVDFDKDSLAFCEKMTLRFGLRASHAKRGSKEESLLLITYQIGEGTTAPFTIRQWLAPRIEVD